MMRKVLILFAGLTLLVSCTKNIDIVDEGKEKNPGTGTTTNQELTLNTRANLTKAIAEDIQMPYGSVIGLYTNFYSDASTDGGVEGKMSRKEYDNYNQIRPFTYDFQRGVWRGASPVESLSELIMSGTRPISEGSFEGSNLVDELFSNVYKTSPLYWPGVDRVYMDYTAYSSSNLVSVLGQLLVLKFIDELSLSESDIEKLESMVVLNPMGADKWLRMNYANASPNRMEVGYNFSIFNNLPQAMQKAFDGSYLRPEALAIIVGLCAITNTQTGFTDLDADLHLDNSSVQTIIREYISDGKLNMTAIKALMGKTDVELVKYIQEKLKELNLNGILTFCMDYAKAYDQMKGKFTAGTGNGGTKDMISEIIGDDGEPLSDDELREVVNKAYCIFMNCVPKISRFLQDDLMYAYGRGLRNNGSSIQVNFNHAKAWVKVVVNNRSQNDILVSAMGFENVKKQGTLIIDNSLSNFEAYWDYTNPVYQQRPKMSETGMGFESYEQTNLDGTPDPTNYPQDNNVLAAKEGRIDPEKPIEKASAYGFIPDMYLVPRGCYGPAREVSYKSLSELDKLPVVSFSYDESIDGNVQEIAKNLGGAMFPVQEPGQLTIAYYSWPSDGGALKRKSAVSTEIDMCSKVQEVNKYITTDYLRTITLNLPRQMWQMGYVYIYVLNIKDNEITIDPYIDYWESQEPGRGGHINW